MVIAPTANTNDSDDDLPYIQHSVASLAHEHVDSRFYPGLVLS